MPPELEQKAKGLVEWCQEHKTLLGVLYMVVWTVAWAFWPEHAEGLDRVGWVLLAAGIIDGDVIARARRFGTQTERNPLKPQRARQQGP